MNLASLVVCEESGRCLGWPGECVARLRVASRRTGQPGPGSLGDLSLSRGPDADAK